MCVHSNFNPAPPPVVDRKVKRPLPPLEIPLEPRSVHEEFSLFKPPEGEPKIRTSPQLLLATHRFLSRGECVSRSVKFYLHPHMCDKKERLGEVSHTESQFNTERVMIVLLLQTRAD